MIPTTLRDALQRLDELQAVQEHLPQNVITERVGPLVRLMTDLIRDNPDGFERAFRELFGDDLDRVLALSIALQHGREPRRI